MQRQWAKTAFYWCLVVLVFVQAAWVTLGIAGPLSGGYLNDAAPFLQGVRNTLRNGWLFPVYYPELPQGDAYHPYTHWPLGFHLSNVVSAALFGLNPTTLRALSGIEGIAVLIVLMLLIRRHFGSYRALVAGTLFVLVPLNHCFANLVNQLHGGTLWTLLMASAYLEWLHKPSRWRLVALLAATFMTVTFSWHGSLAAGVIVGHFMWQDIVRGNGDCRRLRRLFLATYLPIAAFGAVQHLALVAWQGHWTATFGIFSLRVNSRMFPRDPEHFFIFLRDSVAWPFTAPVVLLGVLGIVLILRRRGDDTLGAKAFLVLIFLVPATVFIAIFFGVADHTHIYGFALPAFLIGVSEVLVRTSDRIDRRLLAQRAPVRRFLAALPVVLSLLLVACLSLPDIRAARVSGGMAPAGRRGPAAHPSLMAFAELVHSVTSPSTRVVYSASLNLVSWDRGFGPHPIYNPSYRFAVTLDRKLIPGEQCGGVEDAVVIGRNGNSFWLSDCRAAQAVRIPVEFEQPAPSLETWLRGPFGEHLTARQVLPVASPP